MKLSKIKQLNFGPLVSVPTWINEIDILSLNPSESEHDIKHWRSLLAKRYAYFSMRYHGALLNLFRFNVGSLFNIIEGSQCDVRTVPKHLKKTQSRRGFKAGRRSQCKRGDRRGHPSKAHLATLRERKLRTKRSEKQATVFIDLSTFISLEPTVALPSFLFFSLLLALSFVKSIQEKHFRSAAYRSAH